MADYRRFTKSDWDAYAGATAFADKSNPFIYNKSLSDDKAGIEVIADRTGIEIFLYTESFDDQNCWDKEIERFTALRAEGELRALIKYLEKFTSAPDLAYELDHPTAEVTKGFTFC